MKRKIIEIDETKCNGCGLCVEACHEGAIKIIDGKAKLIHDEYCDGLGDCLPACPTNAIKIIEREAKPFVQPEKTNVEKAKQHVSFTCPGSIAKLIKREESSVAEAKEVKPDNRETSAKSQLRQWPVKLNLINPQASYLSDAHLLLAADCSAYAYAGFHQDFIKGKITIIGCPKFDDPEYYKEKLVEILKNHSIKSITVVLMTVPCCNGLARATKDAMLEAKVIVPYDEIRVSPEGKIIK